MATYSLQDFLKHTEDLATISPAAVELINKINLPSTRRDEIARLVSTDEILLANIFKCTNSAAFNLVRRPKDVAEAIDILGINEIRNLVFAVAAKKVFVDLDLWYQSMFIALTAQRMAQESHLDANKTSNIYIAGLMQSMGTLIFKMFYKKEYSEIAAIQQHRSRELAEEETFGISSTTLAYEIVKDYGLPESIVEVIKTQGCDWESSDFKPENALIDLAISLSEIKKDDLHDQEGIDKVIDSKMLSKFELADLTINPEFLEKLHEETNNFVSV